jgi:hypothetical protein
MLTNFLCLLQLHFLKTDFNRWKDEDDTDDEEREDFNLDEVSLLHAFYPLVLTCMC